MQASGNKKDIKLLFTDFYSSSAEEYLFIRNLIEASYNIIESDKPDYIIYSVFGSNSLNYDCIKIFYTSENVRPNFNICDYAIGFDWMEFEDRYIRFPFYRFRKEFNLLLNNEQSGAVDIQGKKFCNFLYSNASAAEERSEIFDLLSVYKKVESGGRYKNNIGHIVDDKFNFLKEFKFSIAFENASTNGYLTEKIVEAKIANTIPIYWGDKLVCRDFNSKAFINCHNFSSLKDAVDYIIYLDKNDEEYLKILNEPLLLDNQIPAHLSGQKIENFFKNIFEQDKHKAKKRCGIMHEKGIENAARNYIEISKSPLKYALFFYKRIKSKIRFKVRSYNKNSPKICDY